VAAEDEPEEKRKQEGVHAETTQGIQSGATKPQVDTAEPQTAERVLADEHSLGGGDTGVQGPETPGLLVEGQIPEPKYPNPKTPNTRTWFEQIKQIPEPSSKPEEHRTCEIPEPFLEPTKLQIPEPSQYGLEIDEDILSANARLWRLESYADRHGKVRARRVLRFVPRPEPKRELGQVDAQLADELKARPGRGRWRDSRDEAEQFRRIAHDVAVAFRRDKRLRREGSVLHRLERGDYPPSGYGDMQNPQTDTQWPDVPNVLM